MVIDGDYSGGTGLKNIIHKKVQIFVIFYQSCVIILTIREI
jgi:hypothetical protein